MPRMQPVRLGGASALERRRFLSRFVSLAGAWSAAIVACRSKWSGTTETLAPRSLGMPVSEYGARSTFEKAKRFVQPDRQVPLEEAASQTPLHDTFGIITPSSLHFERHH